MLIQDHGTRRLRTIRDRALFAAGGAIAGALVVLAVVVAQGSSGMDPASGECRTAFTAFVAGERAPELRATVRECVRQAY